jgi:outer membrane protein insertion porin family
MHILRAFGLFLLSFTVLAFPIFAAPDNEAKDTTKKETVGSRQQQLVESVDIQGNRRLRDEDLLYYIKTREGDVFNPQQLERDLRELLSLNFFDKTATRVLTEPGVRGGVDVIFEVKELPIIRDLQFVGAKAVPESDILKAFREQRVGISKESVFDPVKARNASRILRELLASKGYPNATVTVKEEEVSATSVAITFEVNQGNRSRIVEIEFEGNENFSDSELRGALQLVKETGLVSRFQGQDILDLRKLEYDLQKNVRDYMFSKGYFQARIGEPQVEGLGYKRTGFPVLKAFPLPIVTSKDDTLKIIVPVTEGKVFRVGEIKVEGNSIFSEQQILSVIGLQKGEIANVKRLRDAVLEDLRKIYGSQGFVQYNAEFVPDLKDNPANPNEGVADITITIEEGRQFRLRRLEFVGNTFTRDTVLRREFLINEGDIYNQINLERSVLRINQTGYFDPVDKDKDVEIRTDEDQGTVDTIVKVAEKGRQQISFNGGISGIGGSFFGLEYSTNNLLGRGEVLSFQVGAGNRQRNLQITFQEPYFRDRPISVGFSLFASTYKFFGEGTFLSQNTDLVNNILFDPLASLTTDESNLFTQTTYGATVFATAPLSEVLFRKRAFTQFSRIGLTYQFSATSISDPEINETDPTRAIPTIFEQPNIITSRVTGSFVYDTRQPAANGIDTLRGRQLSASIALAGLGGDVRTYQPNISYSEFIPVRRKRSQNAEVFAYRILAGTIGSFATSEKIRNANSLSFIGGVPIYERYFLGSEFDVRGYNARAIGPIAPVDNYITTQNVTLATNATGAAIAPAGVDPTVLQQLSQLGILTGGAGANPAFLNRRYQFIGGDTQILGNFEYRIPLFGPATLAAFADVGTVFNLRSTGTQIINSTFLPDDSFVGAGTLTSLAGVNAPQLYTDPNFRNLFLFNNRFLTRREFIDVFCSGNSAGCPTSVPPGITPVYLRGEAQTNQFVRVDESAFDSLRDFRSSVGLELRVQVPVVNVPFRLIYFYNPNAKLGITEEVPGLFLPGKRSGFRFTVGRTF